MTTKRYCVPPAIDAPVGKLVDFVTDVQRLAYFERGRITIDKELSGADFVQDVLMFLAARGLAAVEVKP